MRSEIFGHGDRSVHVRTVEDAPSPKMTLDAFIGFLKRFGR